MIGHQQDETVLQHRARGHDRQAIRAHPLVVPHAGDLDVALSGEGGEEGLQPVALIAGDNDELAAAAGQRALHDADDQGHAPDFSERLQRRYAAQACALPRRHNQTLHASITPGPTGRPGS